MALAAAQVIDALVTRLIGATTAGSRVYPSRTWPLAEADLPAWRVVAGEEEAIDLAVIDATRVNEHQLMVEARGYVRAVADLDDAMHALAEAALPALFANPVPYGLELRGIGRDMSTEGEAAVGVITLRLAARYFVAPTTPGAIRSN